MDGGVSADATGASFPRAGRARGSRTPFACAPASAAGFERVDEQRDAGAALPGAGGAVAVVASTSDAGRDDDRCRPSSGASTGSKLASTSTAAPGRGGTRALATSTRIARMPRARRRRARCDAAARGCGRRRTRRAAPTRSRRAARACVTSVSAPRRGVASGARPRRRGRRAEDGAERPGRGWRRRRAPPGRARRPAGGCAARSEATTAAVTTATTRRAGPQGAGRAASDGAWQCLPRREPPSTRAAGRGKRWRSVEEGSAGGGAVGSGLLGGRADFLRRVGLRRVRFGTRRPASTTATTSRTSSRSTSTRRPTSPLRSSRASRPSMPLRLSFL